MAAWAILFATRHSLFARPEGTKAHDPIDDAESAVVAQPDPRARRPALSAIRDRQPSAGQVARAPHLCGVLHACTPPRGGAAQARAQQRGSRRDTVVEPLRASRMLLRHS